MDDATARRLLRLNSEFYSTFAQAFDGSRHVSDPALTSILPYVPAESRVLDVGCGNGRLALLLDAERPGSRYVGVDASSSLIGIARGRVSHLRAIAVEFLVADVAQSRWTDVLADRGFDCVAALAVLHHIPGYDTRRRLLADFASIVGPGGRIILSTWQFLDSPRLRRKIVPWEALGLADAQLEPGDYLLDWRRGGLGLRYCHLVDIRELEMLATASGLQIIDTARAGGREGNLSLIAILEPG